MLIYVKKQAKRNYCTIENIGIWPKLKEHTVIQSIRENIKIDDLHGLVAEQSQGYKI